LYNLIFWDHRKHDARWIKEIIPYAAGVFFIGEDAVLSSENRIKTKAALNRRGHPVVWTLLFVHLSLTVFLSVRIERHALQHRRHAAHAAQHSTVICSWVCSALTFVHSVPESLAFSLMPSFKRQSDLKRGFHAKGRDCSLYIRGPPVFV